MNQLYYLLITIIIIIIAFFNHSYSQQTGEWQLFDYNKQLGQELKILPIYDAASNGNLIFATEKDKEPGWKQLSLFLSEDGGQNWQEIITNPSRIYTHAFQETFSFEYRKAVLTDTKIFLLTDSILKDDNKVLHYKPVILLSDQLGNTWQRIILNEKFDFFKAKNLCMLDNDNGIITFELPEDGTTNKILVTNDSWKTFTEKDLPSNIIEHDICRSAGGTRLMITSNEVLFFTDDFGDTWQRALQDLPENTMSIDFINADIGHLITNTRIEPQNYRTDLYKTIDNGDSWQKINEIDINSSLIPQKFSIEFLNENQGILTIDTSPTRIFRTNDGGVSLIEDQPPISGINKARLEQLFYVSNNTAYSFYDYSYIIRYTGKNALVKPSIQDISSPVELGFSLQWNNVEGAENYHLVVEEYSLPDDTFEIGAPRESINEDGAIFERIITDDDQIKANSYSFDGLLEFGKVYWLKLKAYNSLIDGIWTEEKRMLTRPISPMLIEPKMDSEWESGNVAFSWINDNGVNEWDFQISEHEDFSDIQNSANGLVKPSWLEANLQPGKKYYWRVKGLRRWENTSHQSLWSSEIHGAYTFTIGDPNSIQLGDNKAFLSYFNPKNKALIIDLGGQVTGKNLITRVYDLSGKTSLYNVLGVNNQSMINLSGFSKGIYFYSIDLDGRRLDNGKFLIKE